MKQSITPASAIRSEATDPLSGRSNRLRNEFTPIYVPDEINPKDPTGAIRAAWRQNWPKALAFLENLALCTENILRVLALYNPGKRMVFVGTVAGPSGVPILRVRAGTG